MFPGEWLEQHVIVSDEQHEFIDNQLLSLTYLICSYSLCFINAILQF